MSKFVTFYPIDLKPLTGALPDSAFQHGVVWNQQEKRFELYWEDEGLESGLSVPVAFPLADMKERKLPKGVKVRKGQPKQPERYQPQVVPHGVSAFRSHGSNMNPEKIVSRQKPVETPPAPALGATTQPDDEMAARTPSKTTGKGPGGRPPRARAPKPAAAEPEPAPASPVS